MTDSPRPPLQRRNDTERLLATELDCWVATASADGTPLLTPLSFWWDGTALILATTSASPAGRSLARGTTVLGVGQTRDVVLIDGAVGVLASLPSGTGDAFATHTGFDPRKLTGYTYFRVRPVRIRAWREVNELAGRVIMCDGAWLTESVTQQ